MHRGVKIRQRTAIAILAIAGVATLGFLIACASSPTQEPGMYNLTGWNYWNGDVNGEVGHRLYVQGPTARCLPGNAWNTNARIISGQLPPGLDFDSGYNIIGIPTQRGHWIVNLELYNVECNNNYYKGFTQELRFHISGSGRVVE